MTSFYDNYDHYKKMLELHEKLRKSEEERIRLEERFKILVEESRDRHDACINRLRSRFIEFLEEQSDRCERNDTILKTLDRIDNDLASMTIKAERLSGQKKQYYDSAADRRFDKNGGISRNGERSPSNGRKGAPNTREWVPNDHQVVNDQQIPWNVRELPLTSRRLIANARELNTGPESFPTNAQRLYTRNAERITSNVPGFVKEAQKSLSSLSEPYTTNTQQLYPRNIEDLAVNTPRLAWNVSRFVPKDRNLVLADPDSYTTNAQRLYTRNAEGMTSNIPEFVKEGPRSLSSFSESFPTNTQQFYPKNIEGSARYTQGLTWNVPRFIGKSRSLVLRDPELYTTNVERSASYNQDSAPINRTLASINHPMLSNNRQCSTINYSSSSSSLNTKRYEPRDNSLDASEVTRYADIGANDWPNKSNRDEFEKQTVLQLFTRFPSPTSSRFKLREFQANSRGYKSPSNRGTIRPRFNTNSIYNGIPKRTESSLFDSSYGTLSRGSSFRKNTLGDYIKRIKRLQFEDETAENEARIADQTVRIDDGESETDRNEEIVDTKGGMRKKTRGATKDKEIVNEEQKEECEEQSLSLRNDIIRCSGESVTDNSAESLSVIQPDCSEFISNPAESEGKECESNDEKWYGKEEFGIRNQNEGAVRSNEDRSGGNEGYNVEGYDDGREYSDQICENRNNRNEEYKGGYDVTNRKQRLNDDQSEGAVTSGENYNGGNEGYNGNVKEYDDGREYFDQIGEHNRNDRNEQYNDGYNGTDREQRSNKYQGEGAESENYSGDINQGYQVRNENEHYAVNENRNEEIEAEKYDDNQIENQNMEYQEVPINGNEEFNEQYNETDGPYVEYGEHISNKNEHYQEEPVNPNEEFNEQTRNESGRYIVNNENHDEVIETEKCDDDQVENQNEEYQEEPVNGKEEFNEQYVVDENRNEGIGPAEKYDETESPYVEHAEQISNKNGHYQEEPVNPNEELNEQIRNESERYIVNNENLDEVIEAVKCDDDQIENPLNVEEIRNGDENQEAEDQSFGYDELARTENQLKYNVPNEEGYGDEREGDQRGNEGYEQYNYENDPDYQYREKEEAGYYDGEGDYKESDKNGEIMSDSKNEAANSDEAERKKNVNKILLDSDTDSAIEKNVLSNTESDFDFN